MKRTLAGLLAVVMAGDGLVQLLAPLWWYGAVPGVPATGPFNHHFVQDIGAAYLMAGVGLGWFAARPRQGWPALVGAAGFLVLHGFIHVADAIRSPICGQNLLRDTPGVFVPALIAAGLAILSIPTAEGASHADHLPAPQNL